MYLIPDNAIYILESDDPIDAWKELSSSGVWQGVKDHSIFRDITADANYLDTLVDNNRILARLIGKRKLFISAHPILKNNYDFLFLVDLMKSAKTPILYTSLEKILRRDGFSVTRREYKNHEILEIQNDERDKLSICKYQNFMLCSYTPSLIQDAIDQTNSPYFGINTEFDEVYSKVGSKESFNIYTQWKYFDEYLSNYFENPKQLSMGLEDALQFSAFDINTSDDFWEMNGFTTLVDSQQSYLRALVRSGSSEHLLPEALSNRTAWYLSFNFSSMGKFYEELKKQFANDVEANKQFEEKKTQIEKLLDISIEKHFVDWIGREIGIAQMNGSGLGSESDNLAIFLRARDVEHAKKRMNEVTSQVKKRTPAKFRKIQYKNYSIEYLSIKGMFKILFGKAFAKMDKPYFTFVGDYAVFSNSPLTLIGIIEDFENGRNLIFSPNYKSIQSELRRSSLNAYAAPAIARPLIASKMDRDARKELYKSRKYIDAFGALAIDLRASNSQIKTRLRIVKNSALDSVSMSATEIGEMYRTFAMEENGQTNAEEDFILQYVEDGVLKRFYKGSTQLKLEAKMKKGKKDGDYKEYYREGQIFITGRYRKDRRAGLWKFFDANGKLMRKKRYSL